MPEAAKTQPALCDHHCRRLYRADLAGLATLGWAWQIRGSSTVHFFSSLPQHGSPHFFSTAIPPCVSMATTSYAIWLGLTITATRFAVARWRLREWFLVLNYPPPETDLSPRNDQLDDDHIRFYTWIYRIFLYTAIALFVYYEFTKALGIILLSSRWLYSSWPHSYLNSNN